MVSDIVPKDQWSQASNNTQDHARSSRSGVSCDLLREWVAGSPRTPCPNVNLDELEIKVPVPRLLRGRLFDQLLQLRPANGLSLVIIFLERRIVFVVRVIGHLRSLLEMHAH
jgi:hypothetical protein